MFSIIIPLYNKANFIKKTIDSVLNQTFQQFEIIIIDDGSTDKSLEAANSITDNRIHVFTKENGGVSAARNYGIKKARYDYIAFLDADDLWMPSYLETLYDLIKQHGTAGMFSTAFKIQLSADSERCRELKLNKLNADRVLIDNYCKAILNRNIFCWTSTTCVKKEALNQVGLFRENIQVGEDIDLWLRIGLRYDVAFSYQICGIRIEESENNIMKSNFNFQKIFPYSEWYYYKTNHKKWLLKYVNSMILWQCQGLMSKKNLADAQHAIQKIRPFTLQGKLLVKYALLYLKTMLQCLKQKTN